MIQIALSGFLAGLLVFSCSTERNTEPHQVYRVYLKGKSIGLIESKQALEDYIDQEQKDLKEKYHVDKVYTPEDLDIIKEITYDEKITSTERIYNEIKNITPFTINGYSIIIKGIEDQNEDGKKVTTKDKTIYVLNKDIFKKAVDNTIRSFIDGDAYDAYLNDTQQEIKETGSMIENVYIKNKILIRKQNIPTNEMIYQTTEDLSKYLMFGTLDEQKKYIVQEGDTISDVSFNNKISNEEFLVANPQFQDENSLLFPGQEVTLGILQPQFSLVEEDHVVELQDIKYTREVRYDNNLLIGTTNVVQEGQDGVSKVTRKTQKINGQMTSTVTVATEEMKPAINEIVVRGGRESEIGDAGYWAWPTKTPYTLSSGFGYRWGTLHDGQDIAGCGYGSPIYAANNGVVVETGNKWPNGIYAIINHNNGYYTIYAHMSALYVQKGEVVSMSQVIGAMGQTGFATGVHLHFGVWKGYPYYGGVAINPLSLY